MLTFKYVQQKSVFQNIAMIKKSDTLIPNKLKYLFNSKLTYTALISVNWARGHVYHLDPYISDT
ncbi:hypothetical protein VIBNISOn1_600024 [Vibrio nigripulchritudo SOn1]|uniref:Uncharacterized protein n=1 Tax=Vibrio nigripulchritudo SOn1 TaxID=1238450 RepID=A0AAV2VVS5_9VIBR|nr:hypothetical protein VIBNISOn1_600024 [Vibrio nigripulchritudo SOn1]